MPPKGRYPQPLVYGHPGIAAISRITSSTMNIVPVFIGSARA
jgi:hypothetical protein